MATFLIVEKLTKETMTEAIQAFEPDYIYWLKVQHSAAIFKIEELNAVIED